MHSDSFEKLVSHTLRGGVFTSASLLVLGIFGLLLYPANMPSALAAPDLVELFEAIATGASSFSIPILLLNAGTLALVLTPLARVLITVLGFAAQREWRFVFLSFIGLVIITVSISLAVSEPRLQ